MSLFSLPNELILIIGEWADAATVSALACASRQLHDLLNPLLYRRNVREHNSSALLWAAENGRIDTAKLCLSHGADINSALSLEEQSQMVEYDPQRSTRGCLANQCGTQSNFPASGTPLHYAVRRGQDDFVEYLLDNGADHQRWCTHLCECKIPMGRVATLLHGADYWTFHWSPLHLALCKGHTPTAKILIDRRVSCEMTCQISRNFGPRANKLRSTMFNVVHEIAIHKNMDVLDYLLDTNCPLGPLSNAVTLDGNTPLHLLAITHSQRSFGILNQLVKSGARNVNSPNNDHLRPIECFIEVGDVPAAQLLFYVGSRPYQINKCILSAAGIRIQESDPLGHENVERRNELVLWLLDYALSAASLTRDVENDQSSARTWCRLFYLACKQPALLQRLLDKGFKPPLWSGRTFLSGMVKYVARYKVNHGDLERLPLLESIRLLTRAGERWDDRGPASSLSQSALERLVKYTRSEVTDKQLRETLIGCLLNSRPPEETGAELAHFDDLCRYALARGDLRTLKTLARYAAEGSSFYKQSHLME